MGWGGGGARSLKGARREGEIPRDLVPVGRDPKGIGPRGAKSLGNRVHRVGKKQPSKPRPIMVYVYVN